MKAPAKAQMLKLSSYHLIELAESAMRNTPGYMALGTSRKRCWNAYLPIAFMLSTEISWRTRQPFRLRSWFRGLELWPPQFLRLRPWFQGLMNLWCDRSYPNQTSQEYWESSLSWTEFFSSCFRQILHVSSAPEVLAPIILVHQQQILPVLCRYAEET